MQNKSHSPHTFFLRNGNCLFKVVVNCFESQFMRRVNYKTEMIRRFQSIFWMTEFALNISQKILCDLWNYVNVSTWISVGLGGLITRLLWLNIAAGKSCQPSTVLPIINSSFPVFLQFYLKLRLTEKKKKKKKCLSLHKLYSVRFVRVKEVDIVLNWNKHALPYWHLPYSQGLFWGHQEAVNKPLLPPDFVKFDR